MSRRKTQFVPGNYYHLYNRGANRERIFQCDENYRFLLKRLKEQSLKLQVQVIAYCLMPNHYHLLIRPDGQHSVSAFMQIVFNSYTKAYNKLYERSGTLFEERFKSIEVDDNEYLVHLCRYIHRNPLEAKLVDVLEDWEYSNYLEWIGQRKGMLVDREFVAGFFKTSREYVEFVHEFVPSKAMEVKVRRLSG